MSIIRVILILIFLKLHFIRIQSKETTCIINGKKSINVVNERFLSFSIDPAILLTGFNLSSTSMKLAQHLNPAFIRIAGPSTELIKFSEDEKPLMSFIEGTSNFVVTPMMWKSLHYWIKNANLTPVFAISDKNRTNGVWNPKSMFPLLDMSENMNFTCYWQLGYDCKDKSIMRYKQDLFTLKQALDEHSSNGNHWKIVGSNIQFCLSRKNSELTRKTLEFLDDITDAVIWQEEIGKYPQHFAKTPIPVWLVVPKLSDSITFSSGLLWAKQIGDAAKAGYEVIFRQPSLQELSVATPVYWISMIYKTLMGRNVLEVRSNSLLESNINIYAHCTKNQNNYSKQGAMTVFVINNSTSKHTTSLRVATSHPGSIEVQCYIITSDGENSANTYINEEKFTLENLQEGQVQFLPTLRRVRVNKLLNLDSPPKSVAFFVLPAAKIPVCIRREDEPHLLMKKLEKDQDINSAVHHGEVNDKLMALIPDGNKKDLNLDKSYHLMDQKSSETHHQETSHEHSKELKKAMPSLRKHKPKDVVRNQPKLKEFRHYLIKKVRTTNENDNTTAKLEIIFTERPANNQTVPSHIKTVELELTNEEIKKILKDRSKSKVAETNTDITSEELDNILKEAAEKVVKNEETNTLALRKKNRFAAPNMSRKLSSKAKKIIKNRQRTKRDINMELLDLKTSERKPFKSLSINNQQIEATIRKVGETSEELLKDIEKSSEEIRDVFAELASSLEKYTDSSKLHNSGTFRQPYGSKIHLVDLLKPTQEEPKENLCPGAKYVDERVKFLMEPSGIETILEEDLNNYHNFQKNLRFQKKVNPRPKFNNEIRNMNTFTQGRDGEIQDLPASNTVKPQFNMEIGEWDTLSRGNYGKTSSEIVRSSTNEGSFPSENAGKVKNPLLPEMATPPEQNLFSQRNRAEIKNSPPLTAVTTRFDIIRDEFSQGNNEKTNNLPSELVEPSSDTEKWKMDTSFGRNNVKATNSHLYNTVRPQFNTKMEKWEKVSMKNNEKEENPSSSKTTNKELWKINTFSHGNNAESIVKPEGSREVWEMDIFSQNGDGRLNNIPASEAVSTRPNFKMWEVNEMVRPWSAKQTWGTNTISQKNDGNIENLTSRIPNNEASKRDKLSSDLLDTSPSSGTVSEVNEMVRPWSAKQTWGTNTILQKNDGNIENLTSRIPNNEASKMDKLSSDLLDTSPSSGTVSEVNEMVRPWTAKQTWGTNTISQKNDGNIENLTSRIPNNEASKMDKFSSDLLDTSPSSGTIDTTAEETYRNLDTYFCNPKNANTEYKMKFKRDVSNITKDDIKNYKKFMLEQLRVMKKARHDKFEGEDAPKAPSKNLIAKTKSRLSPPVDSKDDNLSSDGEHLHIVIGKPYDPEKLHINERRRAKQVQKLKQRFQNRKKLNEKIREKKLQQNEVDDNRLESPRLKRTPYNIHTNEVSDTKKKNWNRIEKHYKRRIFRPKTWKPQDIFKVKKVPSYSVEVVDKREFLQRTAPFIRNKFKGIKKHKRSVSDGIDSSENAIDDYPIFKNKKSTKFLTNAKNGKSHKQRASTEPNLPSEISTQEWVGTTTEETNVINPGRSIKTSVTFDAVTTPTTHPDSVTLGKTEITPSFDPTQKPEEKEDVNTPMADSIIPPHFIDMIMDAVNSTVSSFVHLGEKITKTLSF